MVRVRVGRASEWEVGEGEEGEEVVRGREPVRTRVTSARVKRVREREREK